MTNKTVAKITISVPDWLENIVENRENSSLQQCFKKPFLFRAVKPWHSVGKGLNGYKTRGQW